jgi:signal transduction histidine kinase
MEERPAALLETAVYRLVQEALNNVSKHSRAGRAGLRVHESDSHIEIEVSDDGIGFDPNLVREGFGLVGMRERAALLGGKLSVSSDPGSGTRVNAEIPLGPQSEDEEPPSP